MPEVFGDVPITANVLAPPAVGEVIVMTAPILVTVGPHEEFDVEAEVQIKSVLTRVGLRFIMTELAGEGIQPIPVNYNHGFWITPPAGVQRVEAVGQEVVYFDHPETVDGRNGFSTLVVEYETTDGTPFTDPSGVGRVFTVVAGFVTTSESTIEEGERTGLMRVGLTESV